DVLHTHGWDADIIGWLGLGGIGTRQLIHLHITPGWLRSGALRHKLRRALTRRAFSRGGTRVVAVSEAVRAHWAELLPWNASAIDLIENGVDLKKYTCRNLDVDTRSSAVVGTAVRLAPSKGVTFLIQAVETVALQGKACEVRIAGDGSERPALEAEVRSRGLSEYVVFLGHLAGLGEFYNSVDIYVLPTVDVDAEGLPLGILEAWASGCCVIGTRVKGVEGLIRHGVDGLLVPPGDSGALASAIAEVMSNDTLRRQLASNGRSRVSSDFSQERFVRAVCAQYRELSRGN
ncbi:MAG: glycosyltransferase family 4 protein, partial [Pseudomonadota bacterium]